MTKDVSSETPAWVKIVVGLGIVAAALAAIFLGYKAAVITAVVTFLAVGSDLAILGLLGDESESVRSPSGRG